MKNDQGELVCRSCPTDWPAPATFIANAYGAYHDESYFDWPLCRMHMEPWAMVAGWFPIREVGEEPPFRGRAFLSEGAKAKLAEERQP